MTMTAVANMRCHVDNADDDDDDVVVVVVVVFFTVPGNCPHSPSWKI